MQQIEQDYRIQPAAQGHRNAFAPHRMRVKRTIYDCRKFVAHGDAGQPLRSKIPRITRGICKEFATERQFSEPPLP
jgi:hypothetical protein